MVLGCFGRGHEPGAVEWARSYEVQELAAVLAEVGGGGGVAHCLRAVVLYAVLSSCCCMVWAGWQGGTSPHSPVTHFPSPSPYHAHLPPQPNKPGPLLQGPGTAPLATPAPALPSSRTLWSSPSSTHFPSPPLSPSPPLTAQQAWVPAAGPRRRHPGHPFRWRLRRPVPERCGENHMAGHGVQRR